VKTAPRRKLAATQGDLGLDLGSRQLPVLDERARGARFLSLPVRQVLNSPATTGMEFWSLNPYIGCEFGCSYCYARKTHEWTMEKQAGRPNGPTSSSSTAPPAAWHAFEREILVKDTAPEVLLRTLDPARIGKAPIVIGTATDPYQPAERRFRITRRLLEALLLHRGLHLGIITKSPLIVRDIDVLKTLGERHELSVNISIASVDAALLRRIEARSPAPHARLRALERLTHAGINAGVLVAPILPGITDGWPALAALMEAAKEAGARWVAGQALRLGDAARTGFLPVLRREFPDLVARYEHRYGRTDRAGKDYERALSRRIRTLQEAFGFPVREGMR
jgi:DNA repair photolyase